MTGVESPRLTEADHEYAASLERSATQLRRIVDLLARVPDDAPTLVDIADGLDALSERLENPIDVATERIRNPGWRHDPVSGVENAIAPPVVLERDADGALSGTVEFGLPHRGRDGVVHTGVEAMVMDHVLSAVIAPSGQFVVTVQLTVRFHRPVPLFATATVSARESRREGRKRWATGEIVVDGAVAVSAEGLFVEKRLERPPSR